MTRFKARKENADICGNCKHGIEILTVSKQVYDKETKKNKKVEIVYDCRHLRDSYLCLESNCQCMDATGRDTKLVGSRYPFNKVWNRDCLQGLVTV